MSVTPSTPVPWCPRTVAGVQGGEIERKRRLGYAIRRAREKRELTPPQLAERIGVGRGTINDWEAGESVPSMLYLGPLCVALQVDARLFADLPEEPPSPVDEYLLVDEATARGVARAREPRPRSSRGRRPDADESVA